jgi:cobalt-zinc-cadmium efflux system outer membrane protein
VPEALPELPPQSAVSQADTLQALALEQRLDLAAAHRRVEALRVQRDAIRRYRYVANVQTGAAYEREADDAKRLGPTVQLGLPLFQQGQGAMARAAAELARAEAEVTELENTIQAEVARHLQRMELARLQAEAYREGLIPQREAVVARLKEQADFMLVDSFAVLTARQQEYAAYAGYVDAALTYWTAQTELSRVMGSQRDAEVRP